MLLMQYKGVEEEKNADAVQPPRTEAVAAEEVGLELPKLPQILSGQPLNTLTVHQMGHVSTTILTGAKPFIVLTPSPVHGPPFLLILDQSLSTNDSSENLM